MRLLVTGKTRSGKSTALHRLAAHALRRPWRSILLFDGKGNELDVYADALGDNDHYFGPHDLQKLARALQQRVDELPARYAALAGRGLRQAAPGDPASLLLLDEAQKATRAPAGLGRSIKDALAMLAEQSAALGDVLIIGTQRAVNAVPPAVRLNANANLQLLGRGYFHLKSDEHPTRSGRVAFITAEAARALLDRPLPVDAPPFDVAHLPQVLGSRPVEPTRAPATLYLGPPGSGKTYALRQHPNGSTGRHLYADLLHSHRAVLVSLLEQAGAVVPPKATIPELCELAALAIQAEPTLLLLDNLDQASLKTQQSIKRLMAAAAAVALAAAEPGTPAQRRKVEPFYPRCEVRRLKGLSRLEGRKLLWRVVDRQTVKHPQAVERKVLDEAGGRPGVIVDLARRVQRGDERELRSMSTPAPRINIAWIGLVLVIAFLMVGRWRADSYVVAGLLFALALALRPLLYRSLRDH